MTERPDAGIEVNAQVHLLRDPPPPPGYVDPLEGSAILGELVVADVPRTTQARLAAADENNSGPQQ